MADPPPSSSSSSSAEVDTPPEGTPSRPPHQRVDSSSSSTKTIYDESASSPLNTRPPSPSPSPSPSTLAHSPAEGDAPTTTKEVGHQDDNLTLANLAAASSSTALDRPNSLSQTDDSTPSFILVASLRSQITDLTSQVTSLNSKLVTGYTRIGDLEDDLHESNDQVKRLNKKVQELEQDKIKWEREIEVGGWVERDHVQGEMQRLMHKVLEETKNRETAVQAHDKLEVEIESLTASLFTEANKMVAVERLSRARAEEKMRTLEESSTVMAGLFEELQENLRGNVERLEELENEITVLKSGGAGTNKVGGSDAVGGGGLHDSQGEKSVTGDETLEEEPSALFTDGLMVAIPNGSSSSLSRPSLARASSRSFAGPIALPSPRLPPQLNTSVVPYTEFIAFITYLRQLRVTVLSRPIPEHLQSYQHPYHSPTPVRGVISGGYHNPHSSHPHSSSNHSTSSIGGIAPPQPSPAILLAAHLPLSSHLSQPFVKRCVEEDSDPSLRLDLAPGLGLFSRRTVAAAIVDGTLLIEPTYSGSTLPSNTCTMCGCGLEKWWGGKEIPTTNSNSGTTAVNQTMRKVLGGGGWSISTFTGRSSTTPPPQVSSKGSSSSGPPSPSDTSFKPLLPHQQIHIFRVNDNTTTRYAICPNYCLPRLRAVCEFWTYVRAIERGLLLEEGFHFVGGRGVNGALGGAELGSRNASLTSLGRGGGAGSSSRLNVAEIVPKDVTNGGRKPSEGEVVKVVLDDLVDEKEKEKEKEEPASATSERKPSLELAESTDPSSPAITSPSHAHAKPPVPKRSIARPTTPVLGSGEFAPHPTATSSSLSTSPVLSTSQEGSTTPTPTSGSASTLTSAPGTIPIPVGPPPKLPPRPAVTPTPIAPVAKSGAVDAMEIVGGSTGWEDRCWAEVVRLKEAAFWSRMARVVRDVEE